MKKPLDFNAHAGPLGMPNSDGTHSLGIKPHPHNHSIAKQLLRTNEKQVGLDDVIKIKMQDGVTLELRERDNRPLIDRFHEATFTEPVGLQWIKDKYALRMLIRKAHCFTLDDATSALVADFSLAVAHDLEATRQMAIPPFPVTWIDLNNRARLNRIKELGIKLTPTAAGETEDGPPVERVGWLIHPGSNNHGTDGYFCHYVCAVEQGVMTAPMTYWWHTGEKSISTPADLPENMWIDYIYRLTFGVITANVGPLDASPSVTPMHDSNTLMDELASQSPRAKMNRKMMEEVAGELRHVWGFLVALNAGHLGVQTQMSAHPLPTSKPPIMKNGKPLLPLEHKVLHLHLNKKRTPEKIVKQAITHHHMRRHDVRAHWRQLKSGKRVPVKSHQRGDEKLGRIEKTYHVEK